ncbi:sugar transferase [Streptococcus panodentis]|uniref:Glucosyltransferase 3 n=1 Tax=Streptococcus panodentis TaxID=1581472 RepID=A0ABS5AX86_9STRE|nr:sugar transferase [Streptococcus panodentis]MBP2621175.1 beta-1,6-galactofuranosyltransferase [Streptococcus panodentis]
MKVNITNLYGMSGQSTALIAQNDVSRLAKELGFNELGFYFYDIYSDSPSELSTRLDGIMASVAYGDVVIYQSPSWNGREFDQAFVRKLKVLQAKIVTFIHDIPPLMFPSNYYLMPEYIDMYNQSDLVIVPSEKMRDKLIEEGLTVEKVLIQHMWDHPYDLALHQPQFERKLYFAGSVERFPHLANWAYATPLEIFSPEEESSPAANVRFRGWVSRPELLLELSKGGLGLVWGVEEDPAEEPEYYGLNISHKAATYLAAGLPIIVPAYLSNAELIRRQGLGFVVDSLAEASRVVETLSPEEYQAMAERVRNFSFLLKEGYFSKKVLLDAVMEVLS